MALFPSDRQPYRRKLLLACLLLAAALGLLRPGAAGAQPAPSRPAFTFVDPVVPVAGSPFEIEVDMAASGVTFWCYYERDDQSGPAVKLAEGALQLFVRDTSPPIIPLPCPDPSTAEPIRFAIPAQLVPAGYHDIEVRTRFPNQNGTWAVAGSGLVVAQASEQLELWDGRFRVRVAFDDPETHGARPARGYRLSEESGAFWFFDGRNAEVLVKLLDGGPVNGHAWLFASSLTTLRYTLSVTDTGGPCSSQPGVPPCPVRNYVHAAGQSTEIVDTQAFPIAPLTP